MGECVGRLWVIGGVCVWRSFSDGRLRGCMRVWWRVKVRSIGVKIRYEE